MNSKHLQLFHYSNQKNTQSALDQKSMGKQHNYNQCDDGLNPLGRLIDKRYYESLDFEGKQRYVFELSEKYRRLKQRYYEEREIERKLKMLAKLQ